MNRREFLFGAAAVGAAGCGSIVAEDAVRPGVATDVRSEGEGIKVRFLGSGAAGWKAEWAAKNPNRRRPSSVLLDGRVLIDFIESAFDTLPEGCRPEVLFQTHSHGDHYRPLAAVKSGVKRMYVQETWASAARAEIAEAAKKLSLPSPEVIALPFGQTVEECGMKFTGVPANHSTSRVTDGVLERTSLYLVEKGSTRLLYATDTSGIPGDAARMIGIDPHITEANWKNFHKTPFVHEPKPITALVMEATDADIDEDFRMFVHSSVQTVSRTVNMLLSNGRYAPPAGQHVYLTHLGLKYRDWPSDKIDAILPKPLHAAHDGLEIVLG